MNENFLFEHILDKLYRLKNMHQQNRQKIVLGDQALLLIANLTQGIFLREKSLPLLYTAKSIKAKRLC